MTSDKVAVYVYDTYDFNQEDEPLGYWDLDKGGVGKTPLSGIGITNRTFRKWRDKNRQGGDFLVYSDPMILQLPTPDSYVATP